MRSVDNARSDSARWSDTARWSEHTVYDFALVSTYLPLVIIVARGSVCVLAIHWLSAFTLSVQGLTMITACVVYMDSIVMRQQHFDRACGHLSMCALAVLTQLQTQVACSNSQLLFITVLDLVWSASAGVEVILRTTRAKMHAQQTLKTLTCCIFACVRVSMSCHEVSCMHALLRTFLYYMLCALLLLCSVFWPLQDRHVQFANIVYVCAHVLFVHLYAVVGSVTVMLAVHARLVYLHMAEKGALEAHKNDAHKHDTKNEQPAPTRPAASTKDYSDLIMKLQEAKRANNLV